MRILTWNINGMRTLPQYHPWNTAKSWEGILTELRADIICFQETKSNRTALDRNTALPGPFHAFYSFPVAKGGYSGVAVFSDSRELVPLKAEEGLSGRIQPKPSFSPEERISSLYPQAHELDLVPDDPESKTTPSDLLAVDLEGRALVVDYGAFVLINLYCPNEGSEARAPYRMNYCLMLGERVRQLIAEGREVIVLGDINICAAPIDHCDGHLPSYAEEFYSHPARVWMREWIGPEGPLVDVVRTTWPDRKGMYTCWNQKIQARESNYGTRIDYILLTRGLLPWYKHGDILPSLKGSDHCPVFVDLHDEITLPSGDVVKLKDKLGQPGREPPRLATRFWNEFSGQQKLLSSFFPKGKDRRAEAALKPSSTPPDPPSVAPPFTAPPALAPVAATDAIEKISSCTLPEPNVALSTSRVITSSTSATSSKGEGTSTQASINPAASSESETTSKRKILHSDAYIPPLAQPKSKRQKSTSTSTSAPSASKGQGQSKLSSFFKKPPKPNQSPSNDKMAIDEPTDREGSQEDQIDTDYRLALELSGSQEDSGSISSQVSSGSGSTPAPGKKNPAAWNQLMAPVKAPNCTVHDEPTKRWTVNKPGPNKGKTFFLCSRPVGPGWDRGKGERLRSEVDRQYRCDFFKWASDLRREVARSNSGS